MHLRTYLVRKSKSFYRNQDVDGICEATLPPCGSNRKYSSEFNPSTPCVTIDNIVWHDVVIYDMLDKQYTSEVALLPQYISHLPQLILGLQCEGKCHLYSE